MLLKIGMQFNIIIYSVLAGIITGILFDMYRIVRNVTSIKVVEVIEDILFWILASLIVFTFLLYTNYAFLMPYVYIFIIISLLFYLKLISRYFYCIEKRFIDILVAAIRVVMKNIQYPVKIIVYKIIDKKK